MANTRRPSGRLEQAILWTVMFVVIPASALIDMIALSGGYGNANASVRTLAHIAVITAMPIGMIGVSYVFWVLLQDTSPRMHLWQVCTATTFFAYLLGGIYEVFARALVGHPLPRLEQLAPGVTRYLPVITWVVVITLIAWGILAARHARSARQETRRRQPPASPPSTS